MMECWDPRPAIRCDRRFDPPPSALRPWLIAGAVLLCLGGWALAIALLGGWL